jgi:hypothetical protein
MATPPRRQNPEKYRRFRMTQKARGLRAVRLWVPDSRHPDVIARLERDGALLRGAPEQREADDFFAVHLDEMLCD